MLDTFPDLFTLSKTSLVLNSWGEKKEREGTRKKICEKKTGSTSNMRMREEIVGYAFVISCELFSKMFEMGLRSEYFSRWCRI